VYEKPSIGIKVIVELNMRHHSHVENPSLAEFFANISVFHAGKTQKGI
jgi:hypothetical protein